MEVTQRRKYVCFSTMGVVFAYIRVTDLLYLEYVGQIDDTGTDL